MTETTQITLPPRGTRIVSKKDGQTYTVAGVEDSTGLVKLDSKFFRFYVDPAKLDEF